MRRACLILPLAAIACLAQQNGFVNRRLLKVDLMKKPQTKPETKPLPVPPQKGCLRVDPIERMRVPKDIDKGMLLPMQGPSVDPKMAIPSPPLCQEKDK